jgi:dCMP deaminase
MRISFEEMAMEFAKSASRRSEDRYKKVGCSILNKDGRLLSVGYNGLSPKQKVKPSFWKDRDLRRKYIIHAETNALSCMTRYDKPFLLASTLLPCSACAINIASYGIKNVLYIEDYHHDISAFEIFKFYKINILKYNN